MKLLRRFCLGFLLIFALSMPALADDIECPGITDGAQESPSITGHIPCGDVAGNIECPGIMGHIDCPGLSLLLSLLF